jgi:hypothetical protein
MKKIASMPKAPEFPKPPSADEIAELADRNEDVSRFFSMKGRMMPAIPPAAKEESDDQED